jgi:hypothetical protein
MKFNKLKFFLLASVVILTLIPIGYLVSYLLEEENVPNIILVSWD